MEQLAVKQSNFIPPERPTMTEGATQEPSSHLTMVDRDLQHVFQYVNGLTDYATAISNYATALSSSIVPSSVFVDRGDPVAWDFDQTTLTTDGNWHDMDLSSIVSSGANSVLVRVQMYDDAVGCYLQFRKNGYTNNVNMSSIFNSVTNKWVAQDLIIQADSNLIVEYRTNNNTFTNLYVAVGGWW